MTDDELDGLVCHAEYGHLEGQDYDTIVALVAEVRRLRDGIAAIAARRCLCDHTFAPNHGGPCCGVAGGKCVTCEARALLDPEVQP